MSEELNNHGKGASIPTLTVDWRAYTHFLEESDLTETEKQEFIETIWSIVVGFIDLGFKVESPVSSCGKDAEANVTAEREMVTSLMDEWKKVSGKCGTKQTCPKPRGRTP